MYSDVASSSVFPEELMLRMSSFFFVFAVLMLWSAVWKGIALWKAGQRGQLGWFVALFIVNTFGILEIIYILGFSKPKNLPSAPLNQ